MENLRKILWYAKASDTTDKLDGYDIRLELFLECSVPLKCITSYDKHKPSGHLRVSKAVSHWSDTYQFTQNSLESFGDLQCPLQN